MNDGAREAYLDKASAQMNEWKAKIEVIKSQLEKGSAEVRVDMHNKIEEWQKKESLMKTKIDELFASSAETYEDMKNGVQNMWAELSAYIEQFDDKTKEKKVD